MWKHKNVIFVQLSTKKGIVWKNIVFHEMTKFLHTYGLPDDDDDDDYDDEDKHVKH